MGQTEYAPVYNGQGPQGYGAASPPAGAPYGYGQPMPYAQYPAPYFGNNNNYGGAEMLAVASTASGRAASTAAFAALTCPASYSPTALSASLATSE